jgi:hypothetical protein
MNSNPEREKSVPNLSQKFSVRPETLVNQVPGTGLEPERQGNLNIRQRRHNLLIMR